LVTRTILTSHCFEQPKFWTSWQDGSICLSMPPDIIEAVGTPETGGCCSGPAGSRAARAAAGRQACLECRDAGRNCDLDKGKSEH
jgi:hypothetical protein